MAREHGVFRTAKVLRLEYGKLKRMAESRPRELASDDGETTFLELMPQGVGPSDCLIELEGRRGKMSIQWKWTTASDLAGLRRGRHSKMAEKRASENAKSEHVLEPGTVTAQNVPCWPLRPSFDQ